MQTDWLFMKYRSIIFLFPLKGLESAFARTAIGLAINFNINRPAHFKEDLSFIITGGGPRRRVAGCMPPV